MLLYYEDVKTGNPLNNTRKKCRLKITYLSAIFPLFVIVFSSGWQTYDNGAARLHTRQHAWADRGQALVRKNNP